MLIYLLFVLSALGIRCPTSTGRASLFMFLSYPQNLEQGQRREHGTDDILLVQSLPMLTDILDKHCDMSRLGLGQRDANIPPRHCDISRLGLGQKAQPCWRKQCRTVREEGCKPCLKSRRCRHSGHTAVFRRSPVQLWEGKFTMNST